MQRMQRRGPDAGVRARRRARAAPAPSRPRRRGRAARRTRRRAARPAARSTRSAPTSIGTTSWPSRCQRVLDARAGAQRDLPLQRAAALQDRDLHRRPRRARGSVAPTSSAGRRAPPAWRPVSVPYSATCSRTTLPIRRMPSRIVVVARRRRSSAASPSRRGRRGTRRGRARTRRSRAARARAGRWCRCSRAACAQMNRPPCGRVHVASRGKCSASASSITSRRRR